MIRHELYKIISNRTVVFLTVMVLVLNVLLQLYVEQDDNGYTADSYKTLWEELLVEAEDEGSWENVVSGLSERLSVFTEGTRDERIAAITYTDSIIAEEALLSKVYAEISFQADYPGYLAGVDAAADYYKTIALFGNVDGYAYRNILKMKELYAEIERIDLVPEPSAGIELAASTGVTDILALVIILFVAVMLWLKEREQNMMVLIRTTYNGRLKLAASKLMALVFVCVFLGIGLYGGNALAGAFMYGLGDLGRPLATVYDYGHTLWEVSAGAFLVLNVIFKIIAYIWIALLISAICCKFTGSAPAFGVIVLFGAAGCLMYYEISPLSIWKTFKYLNPFAVLKTELFFMDYMDLNFLENPVDYRVCTSVMMAMGFVLFTWLIVIFFTDYVLKGRKRAGLAVLRKLAAVFVGMRRIIEKHTVLLWHELHRIFICHKAVIVIAVLVFFVVHDARTYEINYMSLENYYEHMYLNELEGPVTDEKLAYIEAEEERVKSLSGEHARAQRDALRLIRSRLSYIERNEGAYLVYEAPHERLTARYGSSTDLLRAVTALIPMILVMPYFFAPDLQTGVCKVTDVTLRGKKKLKTMRYIVGTLLTLAIALVAHLSYFVQIIASFGVDMEVFSYPVNSIPHLAKFGSEMNLGTYYMITYTLKILATVAGAFLVYGLSKLLKSQAYATLAGFIVLVVPFLVAMYDYRIIYATYPFSAALGNLFVQEKAAMAACVATVVAMTAMLWAVNRRRAAR